MGWLDDVKRNQGVSDVAASLDNLVKDGKIAKKTRKGSKNKKCNRKLRLSKLNPCLSEKFGTGDDNIRIQEFMDYCKRLFKDDVVRRTVYSHQQKDWAEIPEHWQIKYLAFLDWYYK